MATPSWMACRPSSTRRIRPGSPACISPPPRKTSTGCVAELQAADRGAREGDDLVRQAVDEARGDGIGPRLREHHRRELDQPRRGERARVQRLRHLPGRRQPERGGHRPLERRRRAAAVLAAGRRGEGREAEVAAAAPVAGDGAERREAHVAAVRPDADAVDAGAARDADAPAVRCRRAARRRCRWRRPCARAQPRACTASRSACSSASRSAPASMICACSTTARPSRVAPCSASARSSAPSRTPSTPSSPILCSELAGART